MIQPGSIGTGIAFSGLCIAAAWLEISGKPAGWLRALIFMWLWFGHI